MLPVAAFSTRAVLELGCPRAECPMWRYLVMFCLLTAMSQAHNASASVRRAPRGCLPPVLGSARRGGSILLFRVELCLPRFRTPFVHRDRGHIKGRMDQTWPDVVLLHKLRGPPAVSSALGGGVTSQSASGAIQQRRRRPPLPRPRHPSRAPARCWSGARGRVSAGRTPSRPSRARLRVCEARGRG